MKKYKYRKSRFIMNSTIIVIIVVVFLPMFRTMNSYVIKYAMPSMIIIFGAISLKWTYSIYKNGIEIGDKGLNIISNGEKIFIEYSQINSISYLGFANFAILDNIVLNCSSNGKFSIESSYYDYFELWSQIIFYSEQANTNVVIQDSVKKRMSKGK